MKKGLIIVIKIATVIVFFTLLGVIGYKAVKYIKTWLPSFEQASQDAVLPGLSEDYIFVLFEDKPLELENYPVMKEQLYLPIEFIISYIDDNFYWDEAEDTLTYTTYKDVIRMKTDELDYFVNDTPMKLEIPVTRMENGVAYMPLSLLQKFTTLKFTYSQATDLLMIDDPSLDHTYGSVVKKKTALRLFENKKSNYIKKMFREEKFVIYGESEKWYYIRTEEGYLGYIEKSAVGDAFTEYGKSEPLPEPVYNENLNFDGKVNIVWHQVTNTTANANLPEMMKGVHDLDVLSPTWFALSDTEGSISNIADIDYVRWAHERGIQVWALFSNSFDSEITHEVLSSTAKREAVIRQILAYASLYELDGINIDFESVASEDGVYFVQFIKELTPYLKGQGLVVSVDMYVPAPWTEHYNRKALGEVIDYLIIMGYDEHWGGSPESGSVASIGFVDKGISDTLESVPKEKVILGLPYYTRIWSEELLEDGQISVSSKAYSMQTAADTMAKGGAVFEWNEDVAQYYGEYVKANITYKCWLEEERSIEEKVKLIEQYDLAGAAGWKLGLEKSEVWDVLYKYLKE